MNTQSSSRFAELSVRVAPGFDPLNTASHLHGLRACLGADRVSYSGRGFPRFVQPWLNEGQNMAFIVEPMGFKVYIDVQDPPKVFEQPLAWCDLYAKVNLDRSLVPAEHAAKVVAAGATFPFAFLGQIASAWHAVWIYLRGPGQVLQPRSHFAHWRRQYQSRFAHEAYGPGQSEKNYVFFSSTIWKQDDQVNRWRCHFIDACRSLPWLRFEGGFAQPWKVKGYEAYTVTERPSHREFLEKTRRSTVVFNTPAVFGCHGWKLAEFLSLGKAIVALPPVRELPAPLVHGEHIHFVEPTAESIAEAVRRICEDDAYRQRLEAGAREYYLRHLHPEAMIARLLETARRGAKSNPLAATPPPLTTAAC